jgi:Tfp pilus assembly protein PilO
MRQKSVLETGIICAAGVIVIAILGGNDNHVIRGWVAVALGAALVVAMGFRYLIIRSQQRLELTSSEQYRRLTDEYRRLTDMAITAQEHTDLKLVDVSTQLDYMRAQIDSLQKILKEVE